MAEAAQYPVLKIKLGVPNDLEILREVRRLAPKKTLRVDANCGWTVRQTIQKAKTLEKLGVEFIEQPIPPGDNAALKRIKQAIGLPLLTDESSLTPEDIPALRGCVDGINLKLVKCGGLREAMKMIHTARACGLKIMIGCMIESSLLITAAAHLTPLLDYADLDGNLLVSDDPFAGVKLDKTRDCCCRRDRAWDVRKFSACPYNPTTENNCGTVQVMRHYPGDFNCACKSSISLSSLAISLFK